MAIIAAMLALSLAGAAEIEVTVDAPVRVWVGGVALHYLDDLRVARAPDLPAGRHLVEIRGFDGALHATSVYELASADLLGLRFLGTELIVSEQPDSGEVRRTAPDRAAKGTNAKVEPVFYMPMLDDQTFLQVLSQSTYASFDSERADSVATLTAGYRLTTWQLADFMRQLPSPSVRLRLAAAVQARVVDPQNWPRLVEALDDRLLAHQLERLYTVTKSASSRRRNAAFNGAEPTSDFSFGSGGATSR